MLFKRIVFLKKDEMVVKTAEYERLLQDSESLKRVYDRLARAFRKTLK